MKRTTKGRQPVYAGFDLNPRRFLVDAATAVLSPRQVGLLMRRVRRALACGDVAFLRSQSFVGRLYRPRPARPALSPALRRAVFDRDGRICRTCGATERLELDHIVPVVWGGRDIADNLQVLCKPCNIKKGPPAHSRRQVEERP